MTHSDSTAAERTRDEEFRLLVDSVHEYAIFMLDPTGHVATWNPGARRLKGYEQAEILGRHFSCFYPQDKTRPDIDAELLTAQRDGVFHERGWRVRKDGSRFRADVTITPVRDAAGVLRGFAKVTRDVSAEERAAQIQESLNDLQLVFQSLGQGLLVQGRDRRVIMANEAGAQMCGYGTVEELLAAPITEILQRFEIFDEHGRPFPSEELPARRVLRGEPYAAAVLRTRVKGSKVERWSGSKATALGGPEGQALYAVSVFEDVTERRRVFERLRFLADAGDNLLSNAIKFSPVDGRVEVRLSTGDSHVEISVSDEGAGVTEEFLPHVFERFRQADSSSTRRHTGLGLGLAIARHLVELHGGQVRVANRTDRSGAVFTVRLPKKTGLVVDTPAGEGTSAEAPSLHGVKLMVVDDAEDARELLRITLEKCGAEVEALASAADVLRRLPQSRPHVLLADIEMPDQDGYQLLRNLRRLRPEQGGLTPAIAVTAYARAEDRVSALAAGFDLHLPKPLQLPDLKIAIARLAGQRR